MNKYFDKMINEFSFEKREAQEQMANLVKETIESEGSCLIEAGTGIGKTLAYLLPAVLYAKENNERVVISTNTINLQEQLIEKDLPLLEKILGEEIKYFLVKGRGNYVCGNRLVRNCTDDNLINWYKKTKTGDRSEIDFYIDPNMWELVKSDVDFCIPNDCARTNSCFFYKARKYLQDAEILIVNHSLLFSNFKYDTILPKFDTIILDEAHNVENIARNYFEEKYSSKDIYTIIGSIYNYKTKSGTFKKLIESINSNYETNEVFDDIYLDFIESLNSVYDVCLKLFSEITSILMNCKKSSIRTCKIKNLSNFDKYRYELMEKYELLKKAYQAFYKETKRLDIENDTEVFQNFTTYYKKLKDFLETLNKFDDVDESQNVKWFKMTNNTDTSIVITPIDIASKFKEMMMDKNLIMTSATLRVNEEFTYIKDRLGIDYFDEYYLKSPFDYDKNMLIGISNNNFDPNSMEYMNYVVEFLNEYISKKNEGSFILCTSYKQLEMISKGLKLEGFNVLTQGEMSRTKLIEDFKQNEKSVLIGTDSFWEGVDVKGERLKNVIIVKLPFKAPDEPITEAIIEKLNNDGKNAFMDYQLPITILKLRQGIGRLIRSKKDTGEVIILDSRIHQKRYGKIILNSLPSKNIKKI